MVKENKENFPVSAATRRLNLCQHQPEGYFRIMNHRDVFNANETFLLYFSIFFSLSLSLSLSFSISLKIQVHYGMQAKLSLQFVPSHNDTPTIIVLSETWFF